MARKYRKSSRVSGRRSRGRRSSMYRKKKYGSRTFAKRVMKVVYKHAETKSFEGTLFNNAIFNSTIDGPADCYNVLPALSGGATNVNRNGEKVVMRGLTITGVARWLPVGEGEPGTAYIFILEDKRDKNTNTLITDQFNFLLGNNNQAVGFDGSFTTAMRPIFSERFRLLAKRTFKFQYDTGTTLIDGASELYQPFKINIKRRNMMLNYQNGNNPSFPENHRIFACAAYCRQDGVVDLIETRLSINANVRMWWKDL